MHPSQMSRASYCARLICFCLEVTAELWLRAPRSPVVHACHDTRLSILFSALLSDPCPIVILVINDLGHRSPRTCEKFGRFICSDPAQEQWVDCARTTDRSAIISRAWPSHWYHHPVYSSSPSFSFLSKLFIQTFLATNHQEW